MARRNPKRVRGHPLRTLVVLGFALLVLAAAWVVREARTLPPPTIDPARVVDARYQQPRWVGRFENPAIQEASGFAGSRRERGRLWVLNDSGHPPELHAIGLDARHHGTLRVEGVRNDDWEDLASVTRGELPLLVIADTGDNFSRKAFRVLHAVVEPAFRAGELPRAVRPIWSLPFRFADGPRDCEAVAVDPIRGDILLLSKRDVPARLYRLAWPEDRPTLDDPPRVAEFVATLETIPQPTRTDGAGFFPFGAWLSQPTSMAIAPDGSHAVVLTYGAAYRYALPPERDWSEAFRAVPTRVRIPRLRGAESIGFAPGGSGLLVSIEGQHAPLYRIDPVAASGL